MQITRVSTQGLRNITTYKQFDEVYINVVTEEYVMSYILEYSSDGTYWMQYIRDDNYDKNDVVGNTYIHFSTLSFNSRSLWWVFGYESLLFSWILYEWYKLDSEIYKSGTLAFFWK